MRRFTCCLPLFALALLGLASSPVAIQAQGEPKPKVSAELPGKGKIQWVTRGLEDRFTLVKAQHVQKPTDDPEVFESSVIWLLEAKADITLKLEDMNVSLFDEDKVRLRIDEVMIQGGIETAIPIKDPQPFGLGGGFGNVTTALKIVKGERIRVTYPLPEKDTLETVKYVVVGSKGIPSDK
jgi:hypothetical protein